MFRFLLRRFFATRRPNVSKTSSGNATKETRRAPTAAPTRTVTKRQAKPNNMERANEERKTKRISNRRLAEAPERRDRASTPRNDQPRRRNRVAEPDMEETSPPPKTNTQAPPFIRTSSAENSLETVPDSALQEEQEYEAIVVPEKTGKRPFNVQDYDFSDAGQVLTPDFLKATDEMMETLFQELSLPPDIDTIQADKTPGLLTLPHDPDTFFLTRPRNSSNYFLLLKVHIAKCLPAEGFRVYEDGVRRGMLMPNLTIYSVLITLCGTAQRHNLTSPSFAPSRHQQWASKAVELFHELRSRGLVADLYTYGSLIATLSKLEFVDQAFRVFGWLKYQGLKPDKKIYTSLIVGCVKTRQLTRATETWIKMRNEGVEPDVFTYNTMIRMEAHQDSAEGALDYMREMEHFQHIPDSLSFSLCIYACAKRADFYEKAFELYESAMARGYQPTVVMLDCLLFVASNMRDIETAEQLWNQFDLYKLPKNEVAYGTMLRTIAKTTALPQYKLRDGSFLTTKQRVDKAEALFDEFLQQFPKPRRRTLNAMLNVFARAKAVVRAEEFRKVVFAKHGHSYDYYTFLYLISMYTKKKQLDKAYDTLQEMKSAGIEPDYTIYMRVLRLCKSKKSDFLGVKVLKEMCDKGITADPLVAFPFQEIVESLPGYKAPPTTEWINPNHDPSIPTRDQREIEQAKRQRQLMLQDPESLSMLERYRRAMHNGYNTPKWHPNNPNFVQNYVNRHRQPLKKWTPPPKFEPPPMLKGLIGESDPQGKHMGEALLDRNEKELRGQWLLQGGDRLMPRQIELDAIRVKDSKALGPAPETQVSQSYATA